MNPPRTKDNTLHTSIVTYSFSLSFSLPSLLPPVPDDPEDPGSPSTEADAEGALSTSRVRAGSGAASDDFRGGIATSEPVFVQTPSVVVLVGDRERLARR